VRPKGTDRPFAARSVPLSTSHVLFCPVALLGVVRFTAPPLCCAPIGNSSDSSCACPTVLGRVRDAPPCCAQIQCQIGSTWLKALLNAAATGQPPPARSRFRAFARSGQLASRILGYLQETDDPRWTVCRASRRGVSCRFSSIAEEPWRLRGDSQAWEGRAWNRA